MQVVYSGGSTTTPSPRLQRKQIKGYGRPVLPGYFPPTVHHTSTPRSQSKEREKEDTESSLRDSIPAMMKPVAIMCLIFNIIIPGLGTLISGFSVLCCSKVRLKDQTKQKVVLVNSWVALLQFITAFILLLGWIWSIVWGMSFIEYSREFYKTTIKDEKKTAIEREREKEKQTEVINSRPHRQLSPHREEEYEHIQNGSYSSQHRTHTLNLPGSASESQQPIIVLQELPVVSMPGSFTQSSSRPILNARTRHEKILRRQMSDNELSPFNLTNEQLEEIVIHAAPLPRNRSHPDSIPEHAGPSANTK
ncbi:uncharacterized protein LOC134711982 [Mytilus trossulus]|uniref:uncharacterized protein LOC134711982 n=1 Tax=Mytilus trossulus TaxID=6551 RepID=UPI0030079D0B